jgi:hypothetical protein
MLSFIIKAAENFCIHQIRSPHEIVPLLPKKRTLIAYLDIEDSDGVQHRAYIGCDDILLQYITEIFLGEEISDQETLRDMLLETTNMIVGSAKVLCEESSNNPFTISTPHFHTNDYFTIDTEEHHTFNVANGEMLIAIKAL